MANKSVAVSHKRPLDMSEDELMNAFYVRKLLPPFAE